MVTTETVEFDAGRSTVVGTLVRPEGEPRPPAVVMAHGFAALRTWALPAIAERFAGAGVAALTFDYRGFGDSGGGPRRTIDIEKQQADVRAALAFVRDRDDLDGDALALWGMSLGGGHVLEVAATEAVDAVVTTAPFTDGWRLAATALGRMDAADVRWAAGAVGRDILHAALDRDPYEVRIVGASAATDPADAFGLLSLIGDVEGFEAMIPEGEEAAWKNRTAARALPRLTLYRPITVAEDVDAPVFVLQGTVDRIVTPSSVDRLVDALPDVHRVRMPVGHFGGVVGEPGAEVADRQARFLRESLL